ncbi:WxL protein host-binding domain-containing protein [Bombilactobacillus bombi]|uniref:WxL protein host-binding domain-containing protein n=1 Tax=Bombilactobacillus bombi TaxID=1303590 RepID=UPI0015E5DC9E|nr:DUF3324 domain-containing protein [Bombilactobacillus bombi]MBA1434450.1 DUF3324 domain-containing protein [Bombilactobacillus bombi]
MIKKLLTSIVAFLGMLLGCYYSLHVARADIQDITVTPIINDSDVTDRFQIIAQPNHIYPVKISVTNFGGGEVKLRIRPTNATTSSTGQIVYSDIVKTGDNGLKVAFQDMTAAQVVTLNANQTKEVKFDIKTPPEKLPGFIMGGFYIYDVNQPNAVGLKVPVWITETNKAVGGVLILDSISPQAVNHSPFINVNLTNNQPGLMKDVTVHMTLRRKGLLELFNLGFKPVNADQVYKQIAPNSNVPVAFDQQSLPIKPGIYQATGTARSGKTKWKFSGSYRITQKEADRINNSCHNLVPDKTVMYLMIVIALFMLIIFVIWGLWSQSRRSKKLNQQQNTSSPRKQR